MIDLYYYGKHMERKGNEEDPKEILQWLEDHSNIIDWEEFEKWSDENFNQEGYEWLGKVFRLYE